MKFGSGPILMKDRTIARQACSAAEWRNQFDTISRMRGRMIVVILLLLGGAIVNVAVAWGLSSLVEWTIDDSIVELQSQSPSEYAGAGVTVMRGTGCRKLSVLVTEFSGGWRGVQNLRAELPRWVGAYLSRDSLADLRPESSVWRERFIEAAGWPMSSTSGSYVVEWRGPISTAVVVKQSCAVIIPRRSGTWAGYAAMSRVLTLRPIWPGFAINTIFYAAILWMMFVFPFVLRRGLRTWRGLCPVCAYPIGTSEICTECGAQVPFPLRGRAREGVGRTISSNAHADAACSSHPLTPTLKGGGNERT
jgi:hypothetical protein